MTEGTPPPSTNPPVPPAPAGPGEASPSPAPLTQPQPGGVVPISETAAMLSTFDRAIASMMHVRLEEENTERMKIQANAEVTLTVEAHSHKRQLVVLYTIPIFGAVAAGACFIAGRADVGGTIAVSTITGVLGFMAGKAEGAIKKSEQA